MADRRSTIRTLYRHDWQDPGEWLESLDQLARLTDAEISRLFRANIFHAAANQNYKG